MLMKSLPLYFLSLVGVLTAGLLLVLTRGLLGGEDVSAETAAVVVAAPCAVLLYFGFRWSGVSLNPGLLLGSYFASAFTVASMVIAFALPQLIFDASGPFELVIVLSVAAAISVIAVASLRKYYRASSPEDPSELD